MVDHQDAFWVERARRGDHAAFGLLVDKYAGEILRFLASKIAHADEAHDVAQDTWLHTYLSLHRLQEPGKFREWTYGIARNRALMWLRQTRRSPTWPEVNIDDHAAYASPNDLITAWEIRETMLHAIAQLSDVNREAVHLHYLADLSYGEIAERLGIPMKTVKSRLHKARQQLKPHLEAMVEPSITPTQKELVMIEATIYDVYLVERTDSEEPHTLVELKARAQERYLPIWIGQAEAESIAAPLRSLTTKRPLPYDLIMQLVEQLSGKITGVELNALRNETFFAVLKVAASGTNFDLDCRPSDALALAVRANVPIFIADDLLVQAGRDQSENMITSGDAQAHLVKPLQLELFRYSKPGTYSLYEQGT